MTPEFLEKMEKWDMIMTLMGRNHEQRTMDCWDSDDGEDFMEELHKYEQWLERLKEPGTTLQAIIRSIDMGINSDDIYKYHLHLDQLAEKRLAEEQKLDEDNNPAIQKLINKHNYKTYEHKRFKTHRCFEFDVNGVHVVGEMWTKSYWNLEVRYQWKDGAGKKHKARHSCSCGSFEVPKEFPAHWGPGDSTYRVPIIALTLAHILTGGKSRKKLCRFGLEVPTK